MEAYEQLKNAFLVELNDMMPGMPGEIADRIGRALDRAAHKFEVTVKETAIALYANAVPEVVKIYIAVKKTEGLSDATLYNYARTLKMFFTAVGKQPADVTANDIRMYLYEYQQQRKVSNRTLDKYREMICWFFSWAHNEEYIPRNPTKSVKAIKMEIKERKALTQIQLEKLRMVCGSPRDKAILEFLYSTGCRVSELAQVKLSDLDLRNGTVHLFGKGRKHRTSFINAKCEVALESYMKERKGDSEYLFVSERAPYDELHKAGLEKIVREMSERSDIPVRVTPHILRHTTATQAVNNGMPIEGVSKLLGHANLTTTMAYAKVSHEVVQTQHTRCVI